MKHVPTVYFSFRSPFSWLAVERMERVHGDVHETMKFVPYWEPDPQTEEALRERDAEIRYAAMSKAKHLYILQDTKRLAEELGMRIAWPIDRAPWWEVSHLGWLKARRLGRGVNFYRAVTKARWLRGENISDPDVIRRLSDSIGLDGDLIVGSATDPEIRAEGADCLAQSYHDDIFGVPYFRLGSQRFWGLDRVDRFLSAVNAPSVEKNGKVAANTVKPGAEPAKNESLNALTTTIPAAVEAAVGLYDNDTAGGCG